MILQILYEWWKQDPVGTNLYGKAYNINAISIFRIHEFSPQNSTVKALMRNQWALALNVKCESLYNITVFNSPRAVCQGVINDDSKASYICDIRLCLQTESGRWVQNIDNLKYTRNFNHLRTKHEFQISRLREWWRDSTDCIEPAE